MGHFVMKTLQPGAGVGNFQAVTLAGWKEKHLVAQMSSQRKGRSPGFFRLRRCLQTNTTTPKSSLPSQNALM